MPSKVETRFDYLGFNVTVRIYPNGYRDVGIVLPCTHPCWYIEEGDMPAITVFSEICGLQLESVLVDARNMRNEDADRLFVFTSSDDDLPDMGGVADNFDLPPEVYEALLKSLSDVVKEYKKKDCKVATLEYIIGKARELVEFLFASCEDTDMYYKDIGEFICL